MGSGCGMDTVNGIGRNLHCTVKSEGHIRSPEIIINGFGQGNHVKALLAEEIGCFLASVSAENDQTAEFQLSIGMLHRFYLIQTILIRHTHLLKRLAGSSQDRSALSENTGKIGWLHNMVICIHQPLITVLKTNDLYIIQHII